MLCLFESRIHCFKLPIIFFGWRQERNHFPDFHSEVKRSVKRSFRLCSLKWQQPKLSWDAFSFSDFLFSPFPIGETKRLTLKFAKDRIQIGFYNLFEDIRQTYYLFRNIVKPTCVFFQSPYLQITIETLIGFQIIFFFTLIVNFSFQNAIWNIPRMHFVTIK